MTVTISYITVVRTTVFYNEHMLMLVSVGAYVWY